MSAQYNGILKSLFCYALAIALGFITFISLPNEIHFLLKLLIADVAATVFIFFCSLFFNNSSLYDPYWSVKPMVFAFGYLFFTGIENATFTEWVIFGLMQLYGLRLTTNFYRDWPGMHHEDWRYINFRNQFPKAYWWVSLGGIHIFPTIMVYLSCLPLYVIYFSSNEPHPFVFTLGVIVLLASIVLAFVADEQMRTFRTNPANKGKFIDEKLWKDSRHPNYLGEILTWWGLFLAAISFGIEYWYFAVGALAINLMFLFVSIPFLDKRSLERRENFQEYIKKTNKLLPFKFK